MSNLKKSLLNVLSVLFFMCITGSVYAADSVKSENTYLNVARTQLILASEDYQQGDIGGAKKKLKHASEWLYQATIHSRSEKVQEEAEMLALKIDEFRKTLNKSSDNNDFTRFWHQSSSLITREAEHLIHNYTESATENKILRYLLDSKMHFYNADHDLFISHDSNAAMTELNKSLSYLKEAKALAKPDLKQRIVMLSDDIKNLISFLISNEQAWKGNKLILSLDRAIGDLDQAEKYADAEIKSKIKSMKESISRLKKQAEKSDVKIRYDAIMADYSDAINSL